MRDPREEVAEFLRRAQMRSAPAPPKVKRAPEKRKTAAAQPPRPPQRDSRRDAQRREAKSTRPAARPPSLSTSLSTPPSAPVIPTIVGAAPTTARAMGERITSDLSQRTLEPTFASDPYAQRVSSLSLDTTAANAANAADDALSVPTTAADLSEMLVNPDRLREAIVLNEILQPPSHRWD